MLTKSSADKSSAPVSRKPAERAMPSLDNAQLLQRALGNQAFGRLLAPSDRGAGGRPPATPRPWPIQPRLRIGPPGDSCEREADALAERVMRMPAPGAGAEPALSRDVPGVRRKCSCGGSCAKCQAEHDHESEELQMKHARPGGSVQSAAPPIVHDVLRSLGQPLDAATRAFMEPRFGQDLGGIQIHTDDRAAESARAVNALAYTVGRQVVFDSGQFQPGTSEGRRLLAHELAHVVQQSQEPFPALQRACRSGPACSAPTSGDPGEFSAKAAAAQTALKEASGPHPAGTPATCQAPRHKDPAPNLTALAAGAGLGVTTPPTVFGIFINGCLPDSGPGAVGAQSDFCSRLDSAPVGAPPKKWCVEVHARDEDDAKSLSAKPEPLNDIDNTRKLELVASVQHEFQHGRFEARAPEDPADRAAAGPALLPAKPDCDLDTVVHSVGGDVNVQFILSEISAEIGEFDVYFKNRKKSPGFSTHLAVRSEWAMQTEEHDIATRGSENILGSLKKLQCTCDCDTVDAFTIAVFNDATGSWTPEEKTEFNKAMTSFMPSFWPKALQVK